MGSDKKVYREGNGISEEEVYQVFGIRLFFFCLPVSNQAVLGYNNKLNVWLCWSTQAILFVLFVRSFLCSLFLSLQQAKSKSEQQNRRTLHASLTSWVSPRSLWISRQLIQGASEIKQFHSLMTFAF